MNVRIHMLGTGAAIPINRGLPCIALRINSDIYLLDTGEGCQQRLFKAGLGVVKVKAIFITHLHGDHYLGLFGMFQSMHLLNREKPLVIIAPQKLGKILSTFIESGLAKLGYNIEFVPVQEGDIYKDDKIKVECFKVDHGIEAYGYRINLSNGKSITYTGDTRPCDNVVEHAKKTTILIHEATFTSDLKEEAYKQGHSTAADAALIASNADVGELVLTHISSRYKSSDELFYDAYRYFKHTIVAEDYMILYL